ncbi:MAG: thioredoxin family protein [bacterium]|nr:thioredoxin family protein [bacterium]
MALTQSFQKLKRGDKAPDFSLQGTDGKTYSLSDFQGKKGLLIVFMCNHCPYVKAKIGAIVDLYSKYKDSIAFVGVNSNDPNYPGEGKESMKAFAKERGMAFPYLFDETQEVAKAYGATCTPDPFLFDGSQELLFHGRIDDALEPGQETKEHTMDEVIENLLAGKEIGDEFKPSLGCSIKWIE